MTDPTTEGEAEIRAEQSVEAEDRRIPAWFTIGAWAAVLFMAAGCFLYLQHVLTNPATLSLDQRYAYEAEPAWVTAAYAVAVWIGLFGTALLVMRRKFSELLLLISFGAVLVWLGGLLIVAPLREAMSANDLLVAIVVAILTWTIYAFARRARVNGWLG